MNYSINKFFTNDECESIIDFSIKNGEKFTYNKDEASSWDCRRIYNLEFKEYVINHINNLYYQKDINFWFDYSKFDIKNVNLSLTQYYDDRWLDLHKDSTSSYTTVISLTDGYNDGKFVLSDIHTDILKSNENYRFALNRGFGITFEGNKTFHGVMPVNTGKRIALNIWMNDTNFSFDKIVKNKNII